ncbi:MAG TPA: hypothetical protein DCE44_05925, partial [Verrucomicrobiales bacterium]|nr:hypothetical protein [Verrucomicrobiales bacterium]
WAALGAISLATANAQVEINISGAVAFRDTAYRSIRALYGANLQSQNPADGPTTSSQLKVNWTGTIPELFGDQTVTIRAFYNGAVAGIQDLTQDRSALFLASVTPGDTNTIPLKADLALSSVFQRSTVFTMPTLEDARFGVTPITLVRSTTADTSITNVTSHQLRTLAANGALPAWFFTSDTNDVDSIYFINRDPTAGQRVVLFKDAVFNGSPISYSWDATSSSYVIDPTGRTAPQIQALLNTAGPAISFLVTLDAFGVNGGANVLHYNGNLPVNGTFNNTANDFGPVINGQYSLWVYEHIFNRTTASANVRAFRDALVGAIDVELQTSAFSIPLSKMKVERVADGAPVAPIE